ncbi:hypothetical protein BKA81DRAFT_104470 [Phyllosticta paracitricarpa]
MEIFCSMPVGGGALCVSYVHQLPSTCRGGVLLLCAPNYFSPSLHVNASWLSDCPDSFRHLATHLLASFRFSSPHSINYSFFCKQPSRNKLLHDAPLPTTPPSRSSLLQIFRHLTSSLITPAWPLLTVLHEFSETNARPCDGGGDVDNACGH